VLQQVGGFEQQVHHLLRRGVREVQQRLQPLLQLLRLLLHELRAPCNDDQHV
jgi:hypothetical protein